MWYILVFFIGFAMGNITGYQYSKNEKYSRKCKNCKHSTFAESKDEVIRIYCQRAIDIAGNVLPIKGYEICGHFDYTDEIKAEQVKDRAEKMLKTTEQYDEKINYKDRK